MYLIGLLILLMTSSCSTCSLLDVHSEYFSSSQRASFQVGTPDFRLPPDPQKIIVSWNFSKQRVSWDRSIYLKITLRMKNDQESIILYPTTAPKGSIEHTIDYESYLQTGGILTYKVELISDCDVKAVWKHILWKEIIRFDEQSEG